MPYVIKKTGDKFCVHKRGADGSAMGKPAGCHGTIAEAQAQMRALHANVPDAGGKKSTDPITAFAAAVKSIFGGRPAGDPAPADKDVSLDQQMTAIRDAWYAKRPKPAAGANGVEYTSWPWIREVFDTYLIVEGKDGLQKVPYGKNAAGEVDFGEPVKVEVRYQEIKGKALVMKQSDGQYRWFGWVSNHFRDKDNPPEIISGKAHREFVAHAEKTGEYPELWLWHVPGSKVGKADWLEFADGFLLISGLFDTDQKAVAEKLAETKDPLTMSHGFWRLKADKDKVITHRYRMVEASITPAGVEANPWTRFNAAKEAIVLTPKKKEFLVKFLGEEAVTALEADTDTMRKAAEAAGVDWKEVEAIEDSEPQATTPAAKTEPALTMDVKALTAQLVPALAEALQLKSLSDMLTGLKTEIDGLAELNQTVKALQADVKALKADDDTKIAAQIAPKAAVRLAWMDKAASRKEETKIDPNDPKDKALGGQKPGLEAFAEGFAASLRGNGA